MSAPASTETPHHASAFRTPKSYYYGHLGGGSTAIVVITAMVAVLASIKFGIIVALAIAVPIIGATVLAAIPDKHQRTVADKVSSRLAHYFRGRSGEDLYRSGPLSRFGSARLPGLLARTEMYEIDEPGQPRFGFLHYPGSHHYVLANRCLPDGVSLISPRTIEQQINEWGRYLVVAANEPSIEQVSVTIETSPDAGPNLRRQVEKEGAPTASELSRAVAGQMLTKMPVSTSQTTTTVCTTFNTQLAGDKKGRRPTPQEMGPLLAKEVSGIADKLSRTGAGPNVPMTATMWAQTVQGCYSPDSRQILSDAEADGLDPDQIVALWEDAGPSAAQTAWDHYQHDGAYSITWIKTHIRGSISPENLARLLAPSPRVAIKRVTLIYTPLSPDRGSSVATSDEENARRKARRAASTFRDEVAHEAARATAEDEARGKSVVDFALIVTGTVLSKDHLPAAIKTVQTLSPSAGIRIRRAYGAQDTAFALGLPVGAVATAHSKVPTKIKEAL